MGRVAVEELVENGTASEIIIADKSRERAEILARNLSHSGAKVKASTIDVTDSRELSRLLRDCDLALGAIGPFYEFEEALAKASIESGTDYLSICDDFEATLAVLSLDEMAKKNGVRIVTGLGMTPGITNILAKYGYEKMDRVKSIDVSWSAPAFGSVSKAVVRHTLHCFSGMVPTFSDGESTLVKAGKGREKKVFPEPIGVSRVMHVGHPEPVTLPRYLSGLKEVTIKGGITPHWMSNLVIMSARAHFFDSSKGMGIWMSLPSPMKLFKRIRKRKEIVLGIRVDIAGEKGGKETRYAFGCTETMIKATGLSLAIGAQMFLSNDTAIQPGVVTPEAVFDPTIFFEKLREKDILIYEGEQMGEVLQL